MPLPRWLTVPAWSFFGLIALAPIFYLAIVAWADGPTFSAWEAFPWRMLGNTVLIATGASAFAVLVGAPCAWLCARTDLWARTFWRGACLIPALIPPYLHALTWQKMWASAGGLFGGAGGMPLPPDPHGVAGVALVLGCAYFPLVMLLTLGGLYSADRGAEEAGRMQQGAWRTLNWITLPLVLPHLLTGALLVFLFALLEFGVPDLLRVRVYTVEIFVQFSALFDPIGAIRLAAPLLLIAMVVVALQVRLMNGRRYWSFNPLGFGGHRYPLGWKQIPALAFLGAVFCAGVVVPVAVLIRQARAVTDVLPTLAATADTVLFSLATAAAAAALMTVLSFAIAHQWVRATGFRRLALDYLICLPLAIPPILLGIALIQIWNRAATAWIYGGSLIVIFGYVAHFIPITSRIVAAYGERLNPHLEESAALLAGPVSTLGRITLPLLFPGLRAAFVVAFVLALGELGVTLLVIPPGRSTLPINLYNYLHYGAEPVVALLSVLLLGLQSLVILGLSVASGRRARGLA